MATTSRLLTLLSLLQTRRTWPGPLLAARLGVSQRTVRRDVDRLRELGYRIHSTVGTAGGYQLGAGSDVPPLLFDEDQAIAVAVALQTAAGAGVGIEDGATRALATLRQVMPSRLRHRLDDWAVTTVEGAGQGAPREVPIDVLVTLVDTIRAGQELRFDYARRAVDPESAVRVPRRVEPHHVVSSQGRWYLVGWDLDRADWRLFSADRVTPRVPAGRRFTRREVPGGDVRQFVEARFKGSDVNTWACRGSMLLDRPAQDVLPWVGDGTVAAVNEHRCRLELGSWSWESLAATFGRFGVPMEVVGPPELGAACATLAERYAAASRPPPESHGA